MAATPPTPEGLAAASNAQLFTLLGEHIRAVAANEHEMEVANKRVRLASAEVNRNERLRDDVLNELARRASLAFNTSL